MSRLFAFRKALGLSGFAIVVFDDATEFAPATNRSLDLRRKVWVENSVVSTYASVRAFMVIVTEPGCGDVVELSATEAEEV